MSSSRKKKELVAIYRLEFYRKKKDWKFCGDAERQQEAAAREDHGAAPLKCSLNQTYSVLGAEEEVDFSEAFLENGGAGERWTPPPPNSPATEEQPWTAALRRNCLTNDTVPMTVQIPENSDPLHFPEMLPDAQPEVREDFSIPVQQVDPYPGTHKWYYDWPEAAATEPSDEWLEGLDDGWMGDRDDWEPLVDEERRGRLEHWMGDRAGFEPRASGERDWPAEDHGWGQDPELSDLVCTETMELELDRFLQRVGGELPPLTTWVSPRGLLRWMLTGGVSEGGPQGKGDLGGESSLDSSTSFQRNAHCAPHSSEVELDESSDDEDPSEFGRLAGAALARRGRRLARALRRLAAELRARAARRRRAAQRVMERSCENIPTRDVGPSRDVILAGCHQQVDRPRGPPPGHSPEAPGDPLAPPALGGLRVPLELQKLFDTLQGDQGPVDPPVSRASAGAGALLGALWDPFPLLGRGRGRGRLHLKLPAVSRGRGHAPPSTTDRHF